MQTDIFENMPIPKAYLKLAIPVVLAMVMNVVYNMVDTWFISLTGNPDLVAGVSVCSPIFILSVAIGDIWGLGGGSLISRLLGEKEEDGARSVSAFCLYLSFGIGLLFMILMLLFHNPILRLLGANDASWIHASSYYIWISFGTPFIIFSMIPNNQLRTEGLAAYGMWGAMAGTISNIILDPIFIFILKMGASGAALATSVSNVISCTLYLLIIKKKCHVITLDIRKALLIGNKIKEIFRIGIPASVTNIMFSLSMLLTNRALIEYGNDSIAAMGIAMKINMISQMTIIGFAFGGQPLFGYSYGSKNERRFKKSLCFSYMLELGLGVFFATILYVSAPFLMQSFIKHAQVINSGIVMLRYMQISSVLVGFSLVTTCVCQSVGHASGALLLSLSRQGILFWISLAMLRSLIGFHGVILAQPFSDLLTGAISCIIIFDILKKMKTITSPLESTL